jgi:YVTN family beta-propeller protein
MSLTPILNQGDFPVRRFILDLAIGIATLASIGLCQQAPSAGPYKVLKTAKVGGVGGYDYVNADADGRRLYIARSGATPRISVFDLDTLEPVGEISTTNAHGVVVDAKSNHGFASSKPILMFDAKTQMHIKTIDVQGNPDGMLFDPSDQRVYVLSHSAPHVTVIDAKEGTVLGTIELGGMPEQAASDGKGHLYIDIEDKDNIAVVDTKTLTVTAHYDVAGKGGTCAGLALDAKNHILFSTCRNPATMVILNADDGKVITTLPIGSGTDGAGFNPHTMEAFSSQGDGTLTIVQEKSPTDFVVEQNVQTMLGARTSTLDSKTDHIVLIGAEFGPPTPPAQPGGRPGRGQIIPDSFSILMVGK